jgi:hypothetical protein
LKITNAQAENLASDIVKIVDEDIWGQLFEFPEEPDLADAQINQMIQTIKAWGSKLK